MVHYSKLNGRVIADKNIHSDGTVKTVSEFPEAMRQWMTDKNDELGLNPFELTCTSTRKAWFWCGVEGHEPRYTFIRNVCQKSGKCLQCAHKKASPDWNFAIMNPELVLQWDFFMNRWMGLGEPEDYTPASMTRVWWKCGNPLHDPWFAPISKRHIGLGRCPQCIGLKPVKGVNDASMFLNPLNALYSSKNNKPLSDYTHGSNEVKIWDCPNDSRHSSWKASICDVIIGKSHCPTCSSHRVEWNINSFGILHPEMIKEWCYAFNDKSPFEYAETSSAKVWWQCEHGHRWQARIANRVRQDQGCPKCNMNASKEERTCMNELESLLSTRISRNNRNIISPSEIDGFIENMKMAFEFNGMFWHNMNRHDNKYHMMKTNKCVKKNIKLIHIMEQDWICRHDAVIANIMRIAGILPFYNDNANIKIIPFNNESIDFIWINSLLHNVKATHAIIAEHYDTIIAMIPFEIINNIAYIHWIENNDFNAIRLFNKMLSMISCNHIILNADRMNDYHDYESYGFVSSSMSSPVLIDFTGNIDNKYNDIVSKYSYYNSGMNEFMMTL